MGQRKGGGGAEEGGKRGGGRGEEGRREGRIFGAEECGGMRRSNDVSHH